MVHWILGGVVLCLLAVLVTNHASVPGYVSILLINSSYVVKSDKFIMVRARFHRSTGLLAVSWST